LSDLFADQNRFVRSLVWLYRARQRMCQQLVAFINHITDFTKHFAVGNIRKVHFKFFSKFIAYPWIVCYNHKFHVLCLRFLEFFFSYKKEQKTTKRAFCSVLPLYRSALASRDLSNHSVE